MRRFERLNEDEQSVFLGGRLAIYFFLVLRVIPCCVMGWTVSNKNLYCALQSILYSFLSSTGKVLQATGEVPREMWCIWAILEGSKGANQLRVLLLPVPSTYWLFVFSLCFLSLYKSWSVMCNKQVVVCLRWEIKYHYPLEVTVQPWLL